MTITTVLGVAIAVTAILGATVLFLSGVIVILEEEKTGLALRPEDDVWTRVAKVVIAWRRANRQR